ncbi:unnamed protein product [Calypogeia fissa]
MDGLLRQNSALAIETFYPIKAFGGTNLKKAWKLQGEDDCRNDLDEELSGSLPLSLVEEVLARLPFKLLFQCGGLSRAWRWNGGGWRTRKQKQQQPPHFFEKAITSVSSKWPTYCPVYLFQDGLVGYNSETMSWEKIFDLSIFNCLPEGIDTTTITSCAGALVCFASVNFFSTVDIILDSGEDSWSFKPFDNDIHVANVVTKEWETVPPRPTMQRPNIIHLIPVGSTGYKLILLTQLESPEGSCMSSTVVTQIFHSATNSWTEKSAKTALPKLRTSLFNFVYFDGVFYIATGNTSPGGPPLLTCHNVEKGTWETMRPPIPVQPRQLVKYYVLICGSDLILVARVLDQGGLGQVPGEPVIYGDVFVRAHSFIIFKLDLATSQIKEVSKCPRERLVGVNIDQVLAHGDTIYFGGKYIRKTPMMMFNVRKQEWSYHTSAWEMPKSRLPMWNGFYYIREPEQYYWTLSALQPGLNPFAQV